MFFSAFNEWIFSFKDYKSLGAHFLNSARFLLVWTISILKQDEAIPVIANRVIWRSHVGATINAGRRVEKWSLNWHTSLESSERSKTDFDVSDLVHKVEFVDNISWLNDAQLEPKLGFLGLFDALSIQMRPATEMVRLVAGGFHCILSI